LRGSNIQELANKVIWLEYIDEGQTDGDFTSQEKYTLVVGVVSVK